MIAKWVQQIREIHQDMVPLTPRSARFHYFIRDAHKTLRLASIVCIILIVHRNAHSLICHKHTFRITVEANMESFRFLGLPKEVRIVVYEQLPVIRRHSIVRMTNTHNRKCYGTLVHQVVLLTIPRCSKMITKKRTL